MGPKIDPDLEKQIKAFSEHGSGYKKIKSILLDGENVISVSCIRNIAKNVENAVKKHLKGSHNHEIRTRPKRRIRLP